MPYVNHRWMGGMLTNFTVMRKQIERLNSLRAIKNNGGFTGSKKQVTELEEELQRLERFFGGMADMKKLPGAIYVVDPRKEHIAVTEARKLGIPIVAITDSNCDPDEIDKVIPGNDDAIRAVKLITAKVADAALEARQLISPEELAAVPEPEVAVPSRYEYVEEEEEEDEKGFAGMPEIDEAEFYEDEALDDEK
jgi:small subunit ribosomal protein S2